ncbi:MAG TPA: 50S ribosomal protein L3 N(5)-glutamine methyltransferase [Gammaproteobacteria bacterium]
MERFEDIDSRLDTATDFIRWGASAFNRAKLHFEHGTSNAVDEALNLVLHGLSLGHDIPSWLLDGRLTAAEKRACYELLRRRVQERKPYAYITNKARFAGLDFYVDERVLVPRSPIAELIEAGFEPWIEPERVSKVLDLCTGSGCIAIACAYAFGDAAVDATEVSDAALEVARLNAESLHVADRVLLHKADVFDGLPEAPYDIIVSNPPYVGVRELAALPPEYRHEPRMALAAGRDGLDSVRIILRDAGRHLRPGGILVVEVGNTEAAARRAFAHWPFTWLEFARGGGGVFLLTAEQLHTQAGATRRVG